MKTRPILFNTENVLPVRCGRKTQTRRPLKPGLQKELVMVDGGKFNDPTDWYLRHEDAYYTLAPASPVLYDGNLLCPYGSAGDRLWVRETWKSGGAYPDNGTVHVIYKAGGRGFYQTRDWAKYLLVDTKWRPSIFMPRWACRQELIITESRPERLLDITPNDAYQEGIRMMDGEPQERLVTRYLALWDKINPKIPSRSNPWVWKITFERAPIDA